MTGHAYATSARTAGRMGPYAGYAENREPTLKVLRMHRDEVNAIDAALVPGEILSAAHQAWDEAVELGEAHGVRNSQASVLAPTGTIGLMMDCDTTGIEPDLALTKAKKLVGGGTMFIVNQTVPRALKRLGYSPEQVEKIVAYIDEHKTILGAPALRVDDLPVFACAMGDNSIHYMGHVKMMAAVQPFISGAISKCVVGETLVSTGDGLVRIGSLYQGERPDSFRDEVIEVASLDGVRKTDAFYYGGVRPVREVVLRSGHKVIGTPNHRLLVAAKDGLVWRRLDEIEEGEAVALRYGAELWSLLPARFDGFEAGEVADAWQVPAEMSNELAFLLGAFAATGRVSESTATVTISHPAPAVLDRLAAAWRNLFGLEARVVTAEGRCPQVAVTSETAVAFLEFVAGGSDVEGGAYRRIPTAVLASPRDMVLAYLQGLLASAGVARTAGAATVTIGLASAPLLDDLQSVLTNLGVVHRRVDSEVVVSGDAARDLFDLVPPADPQMVAQAAEVFVGRDLPGWAGDFVPGPVAPGAVPAGADGAAGGVGVPAGRQVPSRDPGDARRGGGHARRDAARLAGHGRGRRPPLQPRRAGGLGRRAGGLRPVGARDPRLRGQRDREPQHDQHAGGGHGRRRGGSPRRGVAHGHQGHRHLPRQLQGRPAAVGAEERAGDGGCRDEGSSGSWRRSCSRSPSARSCPGGGTPRRSRSGWPTATAT